MGNWLEDSCLGLAPVLSFSLVWRLSHSWSSDSEDMDIFSTLVNLLTPLNQDCDLQFNAGSISSNFRTWWGSVVEGSWGKAPESHNPWKNHLEATLSSIPVLKPAKSTCLAGPLHLLLPVPGTFIPWCLHGSSSTLSRVTAQMPPHQRILLW